jgi:hypothetical protein
MIDETTKQAAQEFLAEKIADENQKLEEKLNREAVVALSLQVWKRFRDSIFSQCDVWNSVTQEETLTCKETPLGDLRIWCAAKSKQLTVHYDSRKYSVTLKNAGRPEHEKDAVLHIEAYSTGSQRNARLIRNDEPVNVDMLILGELRVLTGLGRRRD